MEYIDQVSIQNDESIFSDHASHTNTSHTTSTATPQLSKLSQTKLFSFFTFHPKLPRNSSVSTTQESSIPDTTRTTSTTPRPTPTNTQRAKHLKAAPQETPNHKTKTKRQILISYNTTYSAHPSIIPFLSHTPLTSVTWGHSLTSIGTLTVLQVILQNPNGLQLNNGFHITSQDFCHSSNYGAAAFFFPETNTNWSQNCQHQKTTEPSSQFL